MYIYHYKISWVRFDSRVATVAMPSGISGFLELHAMVLQNVEDLSDDAPAEADSKSTTKAPKAKTKGKPSKSSEAKVEKSEVSKPTVPTHEESKKKDSPAPKRPPVLKRPAARTEAGGSHPRESPVKRPAGNDKKVSIGKGYYKAQNKFGFKVDGKEKFSDPHLNSLGNK